MGRASDILIPSRFLLTTGHFIAVCLAFYEVEANVAAGLSPLANSDDKSAATNSLQAALGLAIICFAVDAFGIFGGYTLFFDRLNLFHCVAHFFGGVLTAWYLADVWGYTSMWAIWACFNFVPTCFELMTLIALLCCKTLRY